jgi:hypothetical protein
MRWSTFFLGAGTALAGKLILRPILRGTVKSIVSIRKEIADAASEAEKSPLAIKH